MKFSLITFTNYLLTNLIFVLFLNSCTKDTPIENPVSKFQENITSISFIKYDGLTIDSNLINLTFSGDSLSVLVPPGTSLVNLTPVIKYQGISISPESGVPQDFSSPIQYTVKGPDGNTHTFTVTVSWFNDNGIVYMGTSTKTFYAIDAKLGGFIGSILRLMVTSLTRDQP